MSRKPQSNISTGRTSVPFTNSAPKTVSRNTAIPRPQPVAARTITHEMIAKRAYEIFVSGKGGSQVENWLRAERELKSSR